MSSSTLTGEKNAPESDPSPPQTEKRILRKIDLRLIPILALLYAFGLIDRSNLGLVRIAGMDRALRLSVGNRYSIVALIFFVPFTILELPANILVRKISTKIFISTIAISWGCLTLASGFVRNWRELVVIRVLLGTLEAGYFPAATLLISTWYIRKEVQTRLATFFVASLCAGGFSPILAYAINQLHGKRGLAGWQWIWIIEGSITASLGVAAYFLVVDFPEKNTFLTSEETKWVRERIERDRGDSAPDPLTWSKLKKYALDLKIWAFSMCFLCTTLPINGVTFFLPFMLLGMGHTLRESFLLCTPPFVTGAFYAIVMAHMSDRTVKRAPYMIFNCLVGMAGVSMVAFAHNDSVRYGGVFVTLCGGASNVPGVLAYQANNVVGQAKKAFTTAMVIGFGSIGGIISALVFRQQDAPHYVPGFICVLVSQGLMIVVLLACTMHFVRQNKAASMSTSIVIEGTPGFKYTI